MMPMKYYICEKCGMSFTGKTSEKDYKQHRIDHTMGKEFSNIHPVTGEPIEKPIIPETKPTSPPVAPEKPVLVQRPTPLILKYRYEGKCERCGSDIKTIEVVLSDENHVIVAYCIKEDKQILQQKVIPITKQTKGGGL